MTRRFGFTWLILAVVLLTVAPTGKADEARVPENFQRENLVAWCIVPFDAKRRGPAARAAMIRDLGMRRVAYDWRAEHVPQFEEEILQYKRHDIEYFAFWSWHDAMKELIKKHGIKPQIWIMCGQPKAELYQDKVAEAAKSLLPVVKQTKELGLSLGIYNHGGWTGEPKNMASICRYLQREHDANHVGIVYNFHHGHEHIADFAQSLREMQPHLLCLNLNGMADAEAVKQNAGRNKIVTIGQGKHESAMIKQVIASGYTGPIGILDHRSQMDAKESLQQNLDGLRELLMD